MMLLMDMIKLFTCTVIFVLLLITIHVEGYDTCWDNVVAIDYTGTQSTTLTGRTCQNWASDSPQSHAYHGGTELFPYDGDDTGAGNYCRDPGGATGSLWCFTMDPSYIWDNCVVPMCWMHYCRDPCRASGQVWCFTMDPSYIWDYCVVPICWNLPCASGDVIGQSTPSAYNSFVDSNSGTNYLLKDTSTYRVTCCGTVDEWRVNLATSGTIRLQIWRIDSATGNYVLLGENVATESTGAATVIISQTDKISVEEDDLIGWFTTSDLVTYSSGSTNDNLLLSTTAPSVGDSVSFGSATAQHSRDYAIGLVVSESIAPSFTNTATTASIPETAAVGDTVFTLTYTDQDPDDVTSLLLAMTTNAYFELSGDDVVVKSSLVVGTETLEFTVTDHCSLTGVFTLVVTVTAVPVTITSLPDSVNVSESVTSQTLLHTLLIEPSTDTFTCTIDSYLPTRTEGNPFLIANTPTTDNGIYLMSGANIRYNDATQINVTVTCSNSGATDDDTASLTVNVDPNIMPVFTSTSYSATFSARSTTTNDVVYTGDVTDAENDPITMSLTCSPTPCPFDVNNNFEVYVTADLTLHQQSLYDVILTANDGFNSVDSSNVSFVITDINSLPVFLNVPGATTDVDENQSAGTSVFQVSSLDANGDAVSYSATYSDADCAAMYDIDSAGLVTTKIAFDYETVASVSCTITIAVFDGYETSTTADLTVDVADVDEPPVMSGSAFTISTEEVTDGTALPDQSISATDPEGAAVTLSISCGADDGHMDINPTTGIVTMTTAFDLEQAGVDTYTVTCVITATDATSLTSTASLSVVVTDANDETPVFDSGGYSKNVIAGYAGYGTLLSVSATDDDRTSPNNDVTYSLTPTTEFNVDTTGNIYNTADLSAVAAGTVYSLTVTATDGGTPPLSTTAPVTITISSATTTTASTATAAASGSSSGDSGSVTTDFFGSTGNVVLLALACFIALVVVAVLGMLIWKYCFRNTVGAERLPRYRPDRAKLNPAKKATEAQAPTKSQQQPNPPKLNNDVSYNKPQHETYEQAQNYHRPRHVREVARDRYKPADNIHLSGEKLGEPSRVVSPTRINVFSLHDV